jgi:hypothetical protein
MPSERDSPTLVVRLLVSLWLLGEIGVFLASAIFSENESRDSEAFGSARSPKIWRPSKGTHCTIQLPATRHQDSRKMAAV